MNRQWGHRVGAVCTALALILPYATVNAAEQKTTPPPATANAEEIVEQGAIDALGAMGKYLQSLTSFSVTSEITKDEVLLSGQKLMVTGSIDLKVQRPDRLRASSKMAEIHKNVEYYYNGQTFTIYDNNEHYYAALKAPDKLPALLDVLQKDYDIELPLRDLFLWGRSDAHFADIRSALFISDSVVSGVACKHYAFRQDEVDWQVWIEDGPTPLPRRLVITSKKEMGQPQYVSNMQWNVAPQLAQEAFEFTPPPEATQIHFAQADTVLQTKGK